MFFFSNCGNSFFSFSSLSKTHVALGRCEGALEEAVERGGLIAQREEKGSAGSSSAGAGAEEEERSTQHCEKKSRAVRFDCRSFFVFSRSRRNSFLTPSSARLSGLAHSRSPSLR